MLDVSEGMMCLIVKRRKRARSERENDVVNRQEEKARELLASSK